MKKRILGLDTGTNSLGWAVVDKNEDNTYTLVDKGSVIFQEGVKNEKGIESSRASERTDHRSLRKTYFRKRFRKIQLLKKLVKYGLCPALTDEQLNNWKQHKVYPDSEEFMQWQRTNDNIQKNPYYYRHRCLHETLDMDNVEDRFVLGRALYHMTQRRGFLSNRLEESDDNGNNGKVKEGIGELSAAMETMGVDYLGDYFYTLYETEGNKVRIRSHYTDRKKHYEKEFYAICERQHLADDMIDELHRAIFYQRPLKSQKHGVGKCTFEPRKRRCAISHPDFEEFRKLSFLNNVKIQTPYDLTLRPLNAEEMKKINHLFYRKSKNEFNFEEIAKDLAGKNKYAYFKETSNKPYKFNYRMTQSVSGCKVTAQLIDVFGEDWRDAICETCTDADGKTQQEIVDEVWNVLYSFSSVEKVKEWGVNHLQLDDEQAEKFSKIKTPQGFGNLSLKAIHKILPFLEIGFIYSRAVFFANIPTMVGKEIWDNDNHRNFIMDNIQQLLDNYDDRQKGLEGTLEYCIQDLLRNNYTLNDAPLYHPSMIETYQDARRNSQGVYQLGSPMTNAVRNPMAMRSLHEVRKLVNALLRKGTIDEETEVHVEYARELNDANKRKAIATYQNELEKRRKKYYKEIIDLYKQETGRDIEPNDDDVTKFQLWEEQNHICLYTGKQIAVSAFIGENPKFDIEHTIPQSVGGDTTKMNLTLCDSKYNREVKKAQIPTQLSNYDEILERIKGWKEKYEALTKDIDKCYTFAGMDKGVKDGRLQKRHRLTMERDYWRGKYERFLMTEVPEGFSRRQGAGIGLVSKYAGLFLKSLFRRKEGKDFGGVHVVKGLTTSEFRKMWGIQSLYEKKSRDNHVHHCIDAITIACIGRHEYDEMAKYYHDEDSYIYNNGNKPVFAKPWSTFTQDILDIEHDILVYHERQDNMGKKARKYVRTSNGKHLAMGDCVRVALHKDTYYGAIENNDSIKYVVRKFVNSFEKIEDLKNIVDDSVRERIEEAVRGKKFKEAISEPIYMNKEKGIRINKVRCFASLTSPLNIRQQRDLSHKDYKQQYHVANDSNYVMGIYENVVKGKVVRDFVVVNSLQAAQHCRANGDKTSLLPEVSAKGFPLVHKLYIGSMVLLYENSPEEIDFSNKEDLCKRLYKVVGMSSMTVGGNDYGRFFMRHHQEARQAKDVKFVNGAYKNDEEYRAGIMLYHSQATLLVQGQDFDFDITGNIVPIKKK